MAELTPRAIDILNPYGSLRHMADKVNLRLSNLYDAELLPKSNIISVDFLRGTRIVEIALKHNKEKSLK